MSPTYLSADGGLHESAELAANIPAKLSADMRPIFLSGHGKANNVRPPAKIPFDPV
ncbi:MAG: hypothetical protein ACR2NR_00295 [Solirubrobacteraceae bacterium]